MKLQFLFLLMLTPLLVLGQEEQVFDTIQVKMNSGSFKRVILYSAKGSQQKYVSYADSDTNDFSLKIPKNSHKGMYRLLYDQKSMNYIDFLYTGKGFKVIFNPEKPEMIPEFVKSEINSNYYKLLNTFGTFQVHLDSLQVAYFQAQDSITLTQIEEKYIGTFSLFDDYLQNFDKTEPAGLLKDLVLANVRVQPKMPIKNPTDYLPYIKSHYFDYIDFNNEHLIYSSILVDKVMDYIFYLTVAQDVDTQNKLYKKSVLDVMQRIDNQSLKSGFIKSLIQSFAKDENISLTDYLFDEFYDKLPDEYRDKKFETSLQQELKTAIGRIAQDIVWKEGDKTIKLSELEGYDYYIIVFWSSTCPHCLKEIPKLYEYGKDKENIKVIAVGMETEESQNKWKSETYYYPNFTHVLALDKWENPLARSYNIYATPTYFILDKDKKIINKPYEFKDLEEFFQK